jgi:hypothetical protein
MFFEDKLANSGVNSRIFSLQELILRNQNMRESLNEGMNE